MRIAIPLWNNSVSPVLDTAERLVVVDIDGGKVVSRREINLHGGEPGKKAEIIASYADMLVCGAISLAMSSLLTSLGVRIHPWTMGNVDRLIQILTEGDTPGPEFIMPGCGRKRRGKCNRKGRFKKEMSTGAPIGNNFEMKRKGR